MIAVSVGSLVALVARHSGSREIRTATDDGPPDTVATWIRATRTPRRALKGQD